MCTFVTVVAALMAVFCVVATSADEFNCPNVQPMSDLNLLKIAREWFMIKVSKRTLDEDVTTEKCMRQSYQIYLNETVSLIYTAQTTSNGTPVIHGYSGSTVDGMNSKLSYVSVTDPQAVFLDLILATDYEHYLLVVTCEKNPSTYVFQLYSTTPTLDDAVKDEVQQKLMDAGISPGDLIDTNQTGCL